jgi:RNA ligase (TIGR02306 family)
MRQLARIVKINAVEKHFNADALDICTVGGWKVVCKTGEFKTGDLAVFFEVDSFVPTTICSFLSKGKEPSVYNNVKGERLRTIKLRGQVSQGLLLPLSPTCDNIESELFEGLDVTLPLGVQKWEPVLPACLAGQAKGHFPSWSRKTDQERCCEAETILETSEGFKTIKNVCDSKFTGCVKSYNHTTGSAEFSPIINWSVSPAVEEKWIKIKTKSGCELIVTPNHRIFNPENGKYQEAYKFTPGMLLAINKN